ncbi:MAG: CPBP family intramembrane metalloprotease, partial [Planctomycetales bacterium]|nr:CPBP family intramembrane metalloprotease [Planctomycetales bacterium]
MTSPTTPPTSPPSSRFLLVATAVEGGLALAAVAVGWVVGFSPTQKLTAGDAWGANAISIGWGVALAGLMLLALVASQRVRWRPLDRISELLTRSLLPIFRDCSLLDLAIVSLMAGLGEEVLFRGLLQDGVAHAIGGAAGVWAGLAVGSIVFGAVHAITPTYAVLAALVGVLFGFLFMATGDLLAP